MALTRALLPGPSEAELLAAMLLDGDAACEAWDRWTRRVVSPAAALAADRTMARPLLPLLYDSVRRNALPVDQATATYLRVALLHETLRSRAFGRIVADLVGRLQAAGVPFLLIKGAAIAERYYREAARRHTHDIELLVGDATALARALAGAPFRRAASGTSASGEWVHDSGLPLRAHTRLFGAHDFDESVLWTSAEDGPCGARTLSATHTLAFLLVHAGRSLSRWSCRWACDAHAILRVAGVDWQRFEQTVIALGAALTVEAQLLWLGETLGVDVPPPTLEALRQRAARASAAERRAVRRGLRDGRSPWWRRAASLLRLP